VEYCIFDIEGNGLLNTITKIWTFSYRIYKDKELIASGTLTEPKEIKEFVLKQKILVGHKIIEYDIPAIEKVLGIKITAQLIDTLGISFYHYPVKGFVHGLEAWGERFGVPKIKIDPTEWAGPLPGETWEMFIEKMTKRCEIDVKINASLFHFQMKYTMDIYDGNFDEVMRLFGYLGYKLDCLREQEEEKIKLDVRLAEKSKIDLEFIIDEKMTSLAKHMPRVVEKTPPKVMYKQDGELSVHGEKWKALLVLKGLPENSTEITVKGNPASPAQLKNWLLALGWKPKTFKLNKKDEKVAQVSLPFGGGLCPSVIDMFGRYEYLEELGGLYRARHRFGLFKSFLENKDENDFIYSRAQGFTNTLRMMHSKPIANLPGVDKYYGKQVRGCLTVPDETYIMCGSDISGLEDNTKQHYIYFYDPDYVTEMRVPGFDPHIDIAVLANLITKEDESYYKNIERLKDERGEAFSFVDEDQAKRYKNIKKARGEAKVINFSATYGAGAAKIAATLKCSIKEAQKLHKTYWKRNAAVKKTAKACKVKTVDGQKWLYNPVSGFWMFLKAEKDRFSTLNQSTGVYVFDSWLRKVRTALKPYGVKVCMQYHDELLLVCKEWAKERVEGILKSAMIEANSELGLNVDIGVSVDWGTNYSECH
jgi:hypothetical protein